MAEFKLGNHTYRTGRMDTVTQFHVARKVAPVLGAFQDSEVIRAAIVSTPMNDEGRVSAAISMIQPLTRVLAEMSESDANYVIDKTLAVVARCEGDPEPGKSWTQIWNLSGKAMMYQDIDMPTMVQIIFHVLMDSFTGFFPARLST